MIGGQAPSLGANGQRQQARCISQQTNTETLSPLLQNVEEVEDCGYVIARFLPQRHKQAGPGEKRRQHVIVPSLSRFHDGMCRKPATVVVLAHHHLDRWELLGTCLGRVNRQIASARRH